DYDRRYPANHRPPGVREPRAGISPRADSARPGGDQGARPGGHRPSDPRARQDPRLPAQRVRLLHRHAHQGRPGDRRDGAADLRAAALPLPEWVTMLADTRGPDEAYATLAAEYSEQETAPLISLIVMINSWNAV